MKKILKRFIKDFEFRIALTTLWSFIVSIGFALYNGILGIIHQSLWNGTICVYFLVLMVIKYIIIRTEDRLRRVDQEKRIIKRRNVFIATSLLLFLVNLSLIVPITLMVYHKKEINMGLTVAISFAAYTTYKIILASINFKKHHNNKNLAIRQIKIINFEDAIVSILSLQYALIIVCGDNSESMIKLSAISSGVGIIVIISISVVSFIKGLKYNTDEIIKSIKEQN